LFSASNWIAVRTQQQKDLIAGCRTAAAMLVRHRISSPFSPLVHATTAAWHIHGHHTQQLRVIQFP